MRADATHGLRTGSVFSGLDGPRFAVATARHHDIQQRGRWACHTTHIENEPAEWTIAANIVK
eukprot:1052545-Pyramimonas_sp.AAC.1